METSTPVETATEAGLPACGKAGRVSSMIEAPESLQMGAPSAGKSLGAMKPAPTMKSATMESATMKSAVIEAAIGEHSAVRYPGAMIEHDSTTAMPTEAPVSPSPAKPAKEANSKAQAKRDSGYPEVKSRIAVPPRPDADGGTIHEPRIVFRHINNLRIGGFDHDLLVLRGYVFLRVALQVPRLFRTVAHGLNGVHHLLLLVDISVAQRRRPFQIL